MRYAFMSFHCSAHALLINELKVFICRSPSTWLLTNWSVNHKVATSSPSASCSELIIIIAVILVPLPLLLLLHLINILPVDTMGGGDGNKNLGATFAKFVDRFFPAHQCIFSTACPSIHPSVRRCLLLRLITIMPCRADKMGHMANAEQVVVRGERRSGRRPAAGVQLETNRCLLAY